MPGEDIYVVNSFLTKMPYDIEVTTCHLKCV